MFLTKRFVSNRPANNRVKFQLRNYNSELSFCQTSIITGAPVNIKQDSDLRLV